MTNIMMLRCTTLYSLLIATGLRILGAAAFEIPNPFNALQKSLAMRSVDSISKTKSDLLQAISFTSNGKDASLETQRNVLNLVRSLETEDPTPETLLTDATQTKKLDGVWYLQYTSPSEIDMPETDTWEAENISETEAKILSKKMYKNNGSVGAVGIKVSTANRVTQQIIDVTNCRVVNTVDQDFGNVRVEGSFRPSETMPTRVVVAFDKCEISFKESGFVLDLGFVFNVLGLIKGTKENGWLETTYLDGDMRIGRGDKGTMFVLTRDPDAVQP